jgi:hypothetical protein
MSSSREYFPGSSFSQLHAQAESAAVLKAFLIQSVIMRDYFINSFSLVTESATEKSVRVFLTLMAYHKQ